jgi:hypothetical protein
LLRSFTERPSNSGHYLRGELTTPHYDMKSEVKR